MADKYQLLDIVELRRTCEHYKRLSVKNGTIVEVLDPIEGVYEVEFVDDDGSTIALLTLHQADLIERE